MSDYVPVPVSAAKSIADQCKKSQVIIVAWDPEHKLIHTTTYGATAEDKVMAARGGELLNAVVGGDLSLRTKYEDFRNDFDSAEFKEALELLADVQSIAQRLPPDLRERLGGLIDRRAKRRGG